MSYTAVIPVLNPGKERLNRLIETLLKQTMPPEEILMPDSASEDGAPQAAACRFGENIRLIPVERECFDHGGTRDMAIRMCSTPFAVMMTQDALPTDDRCMEKLLQPFSDPQVAAVCGRQIAYPEAKARERAIRAFRYSEKSDVWDRTDAARRGITAYLLSDVCAAYRISAYRAVGGFTYPIETNEDMLIAADFLDTGYKLAYQGDAAVWHSHDNTLRQEYERNKKIGMFLAKYGDRFGDGNVTGEGLALVKYVCNRLMKEGKIPEIIPFGMNCAARLLGNRSGKRCGGKQV